MARAMLRGLKKRHEKLQDRPVVMHTVSVLVLARMSSL